MPFFKLPLDESNDRSRVINALNQREEKLKPKKFEYDGNKYYEEHKDDKGDKTKEYPHLSAYYKGSREGMTPKEKNKDKRKTLLSYRGKPADERKNDNKIMRDRVPARYDNNKRTIGINRNLVDRLKSNNMPANKRLVDEKPLIDHEMQHHKQNMIARSKYGVQGARNMFRKEENRVISNHDNFHKSTLEYNANQAGVGPKPTRDQTEKVVDQNILTKKNNNPKINIPIKQGMDKAQELRNKAKGFFKPNK